MATPREGLARLEAAADSGELDALCTRHALALLTVFGSATRPGRNPRDLDIAVMTLPGAPFDALALLAELSDLTEVENIDLAHLNRAGPVLRERALVGSVALFEDRRGRYAAAQTAAIGERIETDPMRRLDLELLGR